MPTLGGLEETYRSIRPWMEGLDRLVGDILKDEVPCVNEMLQYASRYSGKRLRPALVFLIGDICGELSESHVKLGAVVEMIHMATLVHDDVLDRATVRRNVASVNIRWNNKDAVLLGDIIFARAIRLLVSIGNTRALELLTSSVSTICEGEIHQNQLSHDPWVDEATYLQIIERKTASLYAASCELSALLSGAEGDVIDAVADFGMSLGTAFQIIDDCLDISGDESVVGKSLGTDVVNGKVTLPIIHLLSRLEGVERRKVEEIISGRRADGDLTCLRTLLAEHDSLNHAFARANEFVSGSLARLRCLLAPADFAVMEAIAGFVVNRQL